MTRSVSPVGTLQVADAKGAGERRYTIEIVARLTGVGTSTIRHYERSGLVEPARTAAGRYRYSDRDVERVRQIRRLCSDLGVNLAAVEVILHMRERMLEMNDELARLRRLG
jgi:MerR family transcriptional regulator/heat shock protein HspR